MTKGIYCYVDKENDKIVYVGKDSYIDKNQRHRRHLTPSNYNAQPINRVLQNNPDRYKYQVLWKIDDCIDSHLNQMEIFYIKKYDPQFNFTEGGDGTSGFRHSEKTRKKMSESKKGKKSYEMTEETRRKISKSRNTTGFYRVYKQKHSAYKQGFTWCYKCRIKSTRKAISSIDLKKLEEKVRKEGLEWKIIDEENSIKSMQENNNRFN